MNVNRRDLLKSFVALCSGSWIGREDHSRD